MRIIEFGYGLMAAVLLAGCAPSGSSQQRAAQTVQVKQDALILDVRTTEEFQSGHLKEAVNIPIDDLESQIDRVTKDKSKPLWVHCQSGGRSARAKKKLEKMGYTQVKDLGSYENAKKVIGG
jgi:phage shock protein E